MKNISKILFFVAALGLSSCYEDEGNYDYQTLPEVHISGIPKSVQAYVGTDLEIPVEIEYENGEYTDVSYEWRVQGEIISKDKDLNVVVNFEPKPGLRGDFSVIDNVSGVRTMQTFELNVNAEFARGWLVVSNEGDRSELSYVRLDNKVYANIYEKMNDEKLSPNVVQIKEHWLPWSAATGELFIGDQNGSVELDGNSLKRMVYTKDEFLNAAPENFAPVAFEAVTNWDYLISNKKLYTRFVRSMWDAKYHEGKFVPVAVPGEYELSHITFRGNLVFSTDIYTFDNLTKSYKLLRDGLMSDFNAEKDTGKAFNPTNMGKTLLACTSTSVDTPTDVFVGILKGDDGKYYMQQFQFKGWYNKRFTSIAEKEIPNPELMTSDTQWAICMGRPYAYFNSGNKLYCYNYDANTVKELQGTKFDGKIKAIAINPTNPEHLAVAVENKSNPQRSDFMVLNVSVVEDGKTIKDTFQEAAFGNVHYITYKIGGQWDLQGN